MSNLTDYQKDAINKYEANINNSSGIRGLYVYHDVGTGKTRTSLEIIKHAYNKNYIKYALVVTPSSVVSQFAGEVKQYVQNVKVNVVPYQSFLEQYTTNNNFKDYIFIVDEAHNIRNIGIMSRNIYKVARNVHSVVFLSGTPLVNGPFDISKQINILRGRQVLPERDVDFIDKYYKTDVQRKYNFALKNKESFVNAVKDVFSVETKIGKAKYKRNNTYAKLKIVVKKVNMTDKQYELHEKLKSQLLSNSDLNLLNQKLIPKKPSKQLNAFLSQTRQLSNVVKGNNIHVTTKLKKLCNHLIKSKVRPVIVYSNFLKGGLYPLIALLRESNKFQNIELFDGSLSPVVKKDIINMYNNNQVDVLCISPSGAEGLNLKRTREIHILEPHWNQMRIDQVIGRGWRKYAHANLPNNEQKLTVYRWLCTSPNIVSADVYLHKMTKRKDHINTHFTKLIIESNGKNSNNNNENENNKRYENENNKRYENENNKRNENENINSTENKNKFHNALSQISNKSLNSKILNLIKLGFSGKAAKRVARKITNIEQNHLLYSKINGRPILMT